MSKGDSAVVGQAGEMTDAEKINALRNALHNVIAAAETGLHGDMTLAEFVVATARYALERTNDDET